LVETDRFVGVSGVNRVVVVTVVKSDVPSAFVADNAIVYDVFSDNPVI
jgi:hypothetical protein